MRTILLLAIAAGFAPAHIYGETSADQGAISIQCIPEATPEELVGCRATFSGITQGTWVVNGAPWNECANKAECKRTGVSPGTYRVQAIGLTARGKRVDSNQITFRVKPVISCSSNSGSVSCTARSRGLASGFWLANDRRVSSCDDKPRCAADGLAPGNYEIQAVATANSGEIVKSDPVSVKVDRAPASAGIAISCNSAAGRIGCQAKFDGVTSGYWTANGSRYGSCDNRTSCVADVNPGEYRIQVVGTDQSGHRVESGVVSLRVN